MNLQHIWDLIPQGIISAFGIPLIGWSMDTAMTRKLVMDALLMAVWRRKPGKGLILHSDRGSQYCSNEYQYLLNQHGIICSMSRKGNCWECVACLWYKAVMERFFHSLKSEQVYFMNYQTPEEAKKAFQSDNYC